MLIPGCTRCDCGCQCGTAPNTVTVTFSGLRNRMHTAYCHLSFDSCFGSGADAVLLGTGGGYPGGPITGALVIDGGCGYALKGRIEPTIVVSGTGTGADFDVTLEEREDNIGGSPWQGTPCGCPYWTITEIAVSGGQGYTDNEFLVIKPAEPGTKQQDASAKARTRKDEPTVTATAYGGNAAASLTVTLAQDGEDPVERTWRIESVAVNSPGLLYETGALVTFSLPDPRDVQKTPAYAQIEATPLTTSPPPGIGYYYWGSTGGGATFDVDWTENTDFTPSRWNLTPTLTHGGSGYTVGDYISWYLDDGYLDQIVDAVDEETGAITSISEAGSYPFPGVITGGGEIQSVSVNSGGAFYRESGVPLRVELVNGGKFYEESDGEPPCVANINVGACGYGSGAVLEAIVDEDPTSSTFGQVVDVEIVEPGTGYIAWDYTCIGWLRLNSVPIVLTAVDPKRNTTISVETDCLGSGACVRPKLPPGERVKPNASIAPWLGGTITVQVGETTDEDGLPAWEVTGVTASGGEGYSPTQGGYVNVECGSGKMPEVELLATDGHLTGANIIEPGAFYRQLLFDNRPTPIEEVEVVSGGSGYARRGREEPKVTFTSWGGHSATFTPTFENAGTDRCGLPLWRLKSVAIGGNGYQYTDDSILTTQPGTQPEPGTTIASPIRARLYCREAPTVTADPDSETGSGASFTVEVTKNDTRPPTWSVTKVTGGGGSEYPDNVPLKFTVPDRSSTYGHYTEQMAEGFCRVNSNGSITSVELERGGAYYNLTGVPQEVIVEKPGLAYHENNALPPYVAEVTAVVSQIPPSNGSGLEVTLGIDQNTTSDKFGQIISATVDSPGSGYVLLGSPATCTYEGGCRVCNTINAPRARVELTLRGPDDPPLLKLTGSNVEAVFKGAESTADCRGISQTASVFYGAPPASATIAAGGTLDSREIADCRGCGCQLDGVDYFDTPVSITSNCDCLNGQFSASGTLRKLETECLVPGWVHGSNTNGGYFTTPYLSVYCCTNDCQEQIPCKQKIGVTLSVMLYDPSNPTSPRYGEFYYPGNGVDPGCGNDITLEGNRLSGSVTLQNQRGPCSVTITFG